MKINSSKPNDKKTLRSNFLSDRCSISRENHEQLSLKICENIKKFLQNCEITDIFCFISIKNEPTFDNLLSTDIFQKFNIGLPLISKKTIEFHKIENHSQLQISNKYKIPEPDPLKCPIIKPSSKTLVLTPALAISERGHRLGYGGGYYDRYFSNHSDPIKMGVIFEQFYGKDIPHLITDIPVDFCVTEKSCRKIDA